jgi:hypothetical protein
LKSSPLKQLPANGTGDGSSFLTQNAYNSDTIPKAERRSPMRKKAKLFLAAGAFSLASLGVASPAMAGTPHDSAYVTSQVQSAVRPAEDSDNHHTCPPPQFPHCDVPAFDAA